MASPPDPLNREEAIEVYLKLIEYKRSIGTTQWAVLSIFLTASEAVFVFGLVGKGVHLRPLVPIFAVAIYWLGFLLYRRYREFNRQVSAYLVLIEANWAGGLQTHLNQSVHASGLSTELLLTVGGVAYTVTAVVVSILV